MAILAVVGGVFLVGFCIVLGCILNGYVLSVLWGWFVVPTFELPALSLVPAIGIALVVNYLTYQYISNKKENQTTGEAITNLVTVTLGKPLFGLLFGWLIHLFM